MSGFPYWKKTLPPFDAMYRALADEQTPVNRDPLGNIVVVRQYPADHRRVDGISNHFTEDARIDASFNGKPTPRDTFRALAHTLDPHTPEARREMIYAAGRECNLFNPAFAKVIYQRLGGHRPRVLDLSAGWGDRAIAAAAAGACLYHGCDPNPNLQEGYADLIKALKRAAPGTEIQIAPTPAEEYAVKASSYDVCILSPPFFTLERYVDSAELESNSQSVERYPAYKDWVENFLKPYYAAAYKALRPGGWVVVYITDVVCQTGAGAPEKFPLEHDSWEILRELGAKPGMTYGLKVQAPCGLTQRGSRGRGGYGGRGGRGGGRTDLGPRDTTRPARAWFRPPDVSPLCDAFLLVGRNPLCVEAGPTAGWLARADRLGFGGKSMWPYRRLAPGRSYMFASLGDNGDAALACALVKHSGGEFVCVLAPGGGRPEVVDRTVAFVSGLGGTIQKASSAAELELIMSAGAAGAAGAAGEAGAAGAAGAAGVAIMAPGLAGHPEDARTRADWLTKPLLGEFRVTSGAALPERVWVHCATMAAMLRLGLPPTVAVCGPVGATEPYADFVERFHSQATPADLLWFEG